MTSVNILSCIAYTKIMFSHFIFTAQNHAVLVEKVHPKVAEVKKKRAKIRTRRKIRVKMTRDSVINLKSMRFRGLPSMGSGESGEW